ncbi:MAG: hypothetical protein K0Q99_1359 [Clostridia bacterium]|jgi:hypothetical protein|nr:hypothetical protein [Clostridia bacterium]
MWTREYLKTRAKAVLKVAYWKAFLVSIVLLLAGADGGGSSGGRSNNRYTNHGFDPFGQPGGEFTLYPSIIIIFITIAAAFILYRILIGYALEVGGRRFFKQATQQDINMSYLGYAFKGERYLDIIKTMLYRGVLNFLWYLLLIIPGIVKSYAYSMVPYILADNPNIGYSRAVQLSNQMTEGHKFDMFVLDLSFIGWYLLGVLLFFIGTLFVRPYEDATKAELYLVLRQNALDNGYCTADELFMANPI